ncbi:hypothetical protein CHS0354_013079 [Potamilus streckersoni]|uniref:Uncharacterized protein n=1 Tax=Potamilus streckersoni TaxID=2493646 RepID=A0AAE0VVS9_9BIVA|nr:hypothetical protein CHS0354_013079 [Potamilus streckersoni]
MDSLDGSCHLVLSSTVSYEICAGPAHTCIPQVNSANGIQHDCFSIPMFTSLCKVGKLRHWKCSCRREPEFANSDDKLRIHISAL